MTFRILTSKTCCNYLSVQSQKNFLKEINVNDTEVKVEQAELALYVFMQVVIGLGVFGKGPYQEKAVFWTPFSLCQSTQCSYPRPFCHFTTSHLLNLDLSAYLGQE